MCEVRPRGWGRHGATHEVTMFSSRGGMHTSEKWKPADAYGV